MTEAKLQTSIAAPTPPPRFQHLVPVVLGVICTTVSACGRPAVSTVSADLDLDPGAAEQSYLSPPQVLTAAPAHDGGALISGRAGSGARVIFSTPEGQRYVAVADRGGRWVLRLPPAPLPRLYALSSQGDGRMVHALGAVVTAPRAPYAAVLVRAGYAALPLGNGQSTAIDAMDYDPAGFAGVSGSAPPHAEVRLSIDGTAAGVTQADAQGRFALLAANRRLGSGPHAVEADTHDGVAQARFDITTALPSTAPYAAVATPGGWRVQWALNGGGVQTTLLAAAPVQARRFKVMADASAALARPAAE